MSSSSVAARGIRGAALINNSRGKVVDLEALAAALRSGPASGSPSSGAAASGERSSSEAAAAAPPTPAPPPASPPPQ